MAYGLRLRRLTVAGVIVMGASLFGTGCKSNSIASTTNNNSSNIIGSSGGHIDGPNGLRVDFPAGAVSTPTQFTIGTFGNSPMLPPGETAESDVFSFEPHGFTFAGTVTVTLPLKAGANSGTVLHAPCSTSEICSGWDSTPVGGVNFPGNGMAIFATPSFSLYTVVSGGMSGNDAGDQPDSGGAACAPKSIMASQCFASGNIMCTGIGTGTCSCTTNTGPACQGMGTAGSEPCKFTWTCTSGVSETCDSYRYDQDGGGPSNGGSGGNNCATACATLTSAASEMASMGNGCGYFTSP